jgi:hypothetical protein
MASRFVPVGQELVFKPDGSVVRTNSTNSSIPIGYAFRKTEEVPPRPSDPIIDGKSNQETKLNTTAASATKNLPVKVANPMEQFASMNVLWTMACLTPAQYNDPRSYRNNLNDLENIVFSSGGRFDNARVNTFFGTPEYYINNFVMQTTIGANEKTGNSNAIKFSFDVIEPHSMGLLLQSMQAAALKAGYLNYLDGAPFVLRMDIQGYDDKGIELTVIKPKFFVLKLTSTKFTVNESGSVYKVEAVPWNHAGFADSVNTAYSDVKLFGKTVYEMLANGPGSLVAYLNASEAKLVAAKKIKLPDEYVIQFPTQSSDWISSAVNSTETNRSTVNLDEVQDLTNRAILKTITKQSKKIAAPGITEQNAIAAASLGFDELSGGNPLFKRAGDQYDEKTGVLIRDGMTIDPKTRAFQFGQNQSLTGIMNQVILSSDYAARAIDPKFYTPQGYVKWFKLDVQIELLGLDDSVGDYARKITFRVVPYLIHHTIFANATSAPVGYHELMKTVTKEYQYIYTGQNVDILGFNIEINHLFYVGINPKSETEAAQTGNQDQKLAQQTNLTTKSGQGPAPEAQAAQAGRARQKRDPKLLMGYKGGSNDKTVEQNVAENFQEAFISGSSADMISVALEILGDPYWLVDSGISNYFAGAESEISQITNDGTMNYESGNVYVYLEFRTPADINTTTGLYDFSIAGKESPFGGIYRITKCENTFADGAWKQKLTCLRMPGPQGPEVNETVTGDGASKISKTDSPAVQLGTAAPEKNSLVDNSSATSSSLTTDNLRATSRREAAASSRDKTTTTSNQTPTAVGFKYYRDLGQR